MGEQKVIKKIFHPDYPVEITGLSEKEIEKAIKAWKDWFKEWKKDNGVK